MAPRPRRRLVGPSLDRTAIARPGDQLACGTEVEGLASGDDDVLCSSFEFGRPREKGGPHRCCRCAAHFEPLVVMTFDASEHLGEH